MSGCGMLGEKGLDYNWMKGGEEFLTVLLYVVAVLVCQGS